MTSNIFIKEKEEKKNTVTEPRSEAHRYPLPLLQRDMNQLFEDFTRSVEMWRPRFVEPMFGDFQIKIDFKDNEKEIIVTAEIPGVAEKDIDISLTTDTLIIKGEKREEKEEHDKGYYRSERSYGCFQRILPLPCEIEREKVEASYKNGIIKIVLAKSTESLKSIKKIQIKTENN